MATTFRRPQLPRSSRRPDNVGRQHLAFKDLLLHYRHRGCRRRRRRFRARIWVPQFNHRRVISGRRRPRHGCYRHRLNVVDLCRPTSYLRYNDLFWFRLSVTFLYWCRLVWDFLFSPFLNLKLGPNPNCLCGLFYFSLCDFVRCFRYDLLVLDYLEAALTLALQFALWFCVCV